MKKFKAGQRWSDNFDYCGMLKAGKKAKVSDGIGNLNRLYDSFEDVNYHYEIKPLWTAIKLLEKGKKKSATPYVKSFNKRCNKSLKETC